MEMERQPGIFRYFKQIPGVDTEYEPLANVSIGGGDPTIILNNGKEAKKEVKKEKIKRVERETDDYKEKNRIYGVLNGDSKDNNEANEDLDDIKERLLILEEQLGNMFEYIKKMNK